MEKEEFMEKVVGKKLTCFDDRYYEWVCGNEPTGVVTLEDEESDGWQTTTELRVDREGRIVDLVGYSARNDAQNVWLSLEDFVEGGYDAVMSALEGRLEKEETKPDPREDEVRELFDSFGFAEAMKESFKSRVGIRPSAHPVFTVATYRQLCAEAKEKVYMPYMALIRKRSELLARKPSAARDAAIAENIASSREYEKSFGMSPQAFVDRFSRLRELLGSLG